MPDWTQSPQELAERWAATCRKRSAQEKARFFVSLGYDLYSIGRSYLKLNLEKIDPREPAHPRSADILAIRKDRPDVARALGLDRDR